MEKVYGKSNWSRIWYVALNVLLKAKSVNFRGLTGNILADFPRCHNKGPAVSSTVFVVTAKIKTYWKQNNKLDLNLASARINNLSRDRRGGGVGMKTTMK